MAKTEKDRDILNRVNGGILRGLGRLTSVVLKVLYGADFVDVSQKELESRLIQEIQSATSSIVIVGDTFSEKLLSWVTTHRDAGNVPEVKILCSEGFWSQHGQALQRFIGKGVNVYIFQTPSNAGAVIIDNKRTVINKNDSVGNFLQINTDPELVSDDLKWVRRLINNTVEVPAPHVEQSLIPRDQV
jgi:hypothetical protein